LIEHLDRRIFIVLRDGRKLAGILRSFDQFANIVLEQTVERIFVGNKYGEKPLGIFLIRGENVVILGEVVRCRPDYSRCFDECCHYIEHNTCIQDVEKEKQLRESGKWDKVEFSVIEKLDKAEKEAKIEQAKLKRKLLLSRGLTSVASSSGYSLFGFDPFHAQLFDDGGGI
jgi:small nuclear ribonucleoprotein (snRNP)-like protein